MTELSSSKNFRYSILITSLLLAFGAFVTAAVSIFLYALDYDTIGKFLLTFSIILCISVLIFCWIYLYLSGRLQGYITNGYPFVFGEFIRLETHRDVETPKSFSSKDEFPPNYDTLPTTACETPNELPSYNEFYTKEGESEL